MSAARPPAWSACSGSTRRPTSRTPLHAGDRTYPETNCYTDILIELLHARGDEPLAAMGSHGADGLRGRPVDVLQAARRRTSSGCSASTSTRCSPTGRCRSRSPSSSRAGRTMIVELDSWYLPDTAATELPHASTSRRSVVAEAIDPEARAAALLPQRRPATSSRARTTAASSASARRSPTTSCRPTPSSCASTPARGCRATSCARRPASCCARHLGAPPGDQPVRALRRRARARPAGAARRATPPTTTPTRSRPCGWSASAFEVARLARRAGCSATPARRPPTALRRIVDGSQGALASSSPAAARSTRPGVAALAEAWDEALTGSMRRRLSDGPPPPAASASTATSAELDAGWEAAGARRTPPTRGARRPRLAAGDGARDGRRRAARRRAWRRATPRPRRRGLVVPHRASTPRRPAPARRSCCASTGIATVAEVFLERRAARSRATRCSPRTRSTSARRLRGDERAGDPLPRARRRCSRAPRRPRARWRTRARRRRRLRFFRTMLLGRAPGLRPGPAAGRPVAAGRARAPPRLAVEALRAAAAPRGRRRRARRARRAARARRRRASRAVEVELTGPSGRHRARSRLAPTATARRRAGELRVPGVARWWPHTHGEPALHDVRLRVGRPTARSRSTPAASASATLAAGAEPDHDVEADGLDLHVNGVRVFARGAVWTPVDPVGLAPTRAELRAALERGPRRRA